MPYNRGQQIPIKTLKTLQKKEADFALKTRRHSIWDFVGVDEESWKIYKKSGYDAYVENVNKLNFVKDIQDLNFHYDCKIDYETDYACHNGSDCCDNDYCRCGTIHSTKVKTAPSVEDFQSKVDKHIDSGPVSNYFFNRIYSIRKLYDTDSYEVIVGGGYYGQEIDGVKIDNPKIKDDLLFFWEHQNDLQAVQEYLLVQEYGYIHDKLKGKKYSLEELPLGVIKTKADTHYEKIDPSYEIDIHNVLGVVLEEDDASLMDGYHRVKNANLQGLERGLFVIAK